MTERRPETTTGEKKPTAGAAGEKSRKKERRSGVWGECLLLELRSSGLLDDLLS